MQVQTRKNQSGGEAVCARQDELLDYLYDEMPTAGRAAFAAHAETCVTCATDLAGLRSVRAELGTWDVSSTAPRLEIILPRSRWDLLREFFQTFPLWSRGAMATGALAALFLLAFGLSGFGQMLRSGAATTAHPTTQATQATNQDATAASAPELAASVPTSVQAQIQTQVKAEIARTVEEAVAQALVQERAVWRAELTALTTRNAAQQRQLQTVTRQLRTVETRHAALLLEGEPSLRRLIANYGEASNEQ